MRSWMLCVAFAVGCSNNPSTNIKSTQGDGDEDDVDTTPCVIEHEPVDGAQPADVDVLIQAVVTDEDSGVFMVSVVYKQETSTQWEDFPLTKAADASYSGKIPAQDVGSGGMDYFIECLDLEENEAFAPDEGEEDPYHFRVSMQ